MTTETSAHPDRSYNLQSLEEPREGYIAFWCRHLDAPDVRARLLDTRNGHGFHVLGWDCPKCGSRWEVAQVFGSSDYPTSWVAGRVKEQGTLGIGIGRGIEGIQYDLQPIINWEN